MAEEFIEAGQKFAQLVEVMAKLRAPGGCPWDRKQTFDTIKSYLLEEAYELDEAILAGNDPSMQEELGDVLLQVLFHSVIAEEPRYDRRSAARGLHAGHRFNHHHRLFGQFPSTAMGVRRWRPGRPIRG